MLLDSPSWSTTSCLRSCLYVLRCLISCTVCLQQRLLLLILRVRICTAPRRNTAGVGGCGPGLWLIWRGEPHSKNFWCRRWRHGTCTLIEVLLSCDSRCSLITRRSRPTAA